MSRTTLRLSAVAGAALAALVLWLLARAFGMELRAPAFGAAPVTEIPAGMVVMTAGFAALAGWAALAVLERFTDRARGIWTAVAIAVAVASLSMPFAGSGVTTGNRLVLALMHLAVAAVVIPSLARTSSRRESPAVLGREAAGRAAG